MLAVALAITGSVTWIDFNGYQGEGLAPQPSSGQLDSDDWRVTGMNDGDTSFGGTFVEGDAAEGASSGGESAGGLWAFSTEPGDPSFGFQQTSDDLTPGHILLRLVNQTGETIVSPVLRYEGWVWNDAGRSTVVEVAWSLDGVGFVTIGDLQLTSPVDADATPAWDHNALQATLVGAVVPPDGRLFLRWSPDDNGGDGGYDEIGLDDIMLVISGEEPDPEPDAPDAGVSGPDEDVPDAGLDVPDDEPRSDEDEGYVAVGCAASRGVGALPLVLLLLVCARIRARIRS
jgi:hypothetical protein